MFSFEEKVDWLVEFYECAGFADFYNRVVKHMSREAIEASFADIEDYVVEIEGI